VVHIKPVESNQNSCTIHTRKLLMSQCYARVIYELYALLVACNEILKKT